MTKEFVLVVLVCALASMVGGDYGPPKPSFIIQPAGPSKQHAWVGYGYSDYLPLSIPKPYFIPKWVPHMDPTYTAFWVPETPAPAGRHKASHPAGPPHIKGFGPPKGNSVVAAPADSYASSDSILPLKAVRAPLPHQPVRAPLPHQPVRAPLPHQPQPPLPPQPQLHLPPQRQPPLFDSPVPKAPVPLATLPLVATTQDPFATFAPAPLGQTSELRAAPPAPAAFRRPPTGFDSSFVPPKGEDVVSNSVIPLSGTGDSSYTEV